MLKKCDISKPYIFVSYSHVDKEVVHRDVSRFKERGYNIWIDKELDKKQPGWDVEALKRIKDRNCKLVLFYFSEHSLLSENCRKELYETRSEGAKLLHKRKEVPFIAVNVTEVGDLDEFVDICVDTAIASEEDPDKQIARAKAIYEFIGAFFRNNTKLRQDSLEMYSNAQDYYEELEKDFPQPIKEQRLAYVESKKEQSNESKVSFAMDSKTKESSVSSVSIEGSTDAVLGEKNRKQVEGSHAVPEVVASMMSDAQEDDLGQETNRDMPAKSLEKSGRVENSSPKNIFLSQVLDQAQSNSDFQGWQLGLSGSIHDTFMALTSETFREKFPHKLDWYATGKKVHAKFYTGNKELLSVLSAHEEEIVLALKKEVSHLQGAVVTSRMDKSEKGFLIETQDLTRNSTDIAAASDWLVQVSVILLSVVNHFGG